jgi:propanol-preferring alcohol dehydrogenase
MLLREPGVRGLSNLQLESVELPLLGARDVLIEVRACGVCRTDLHIIEGDLPKRHPQIVPGHQIVGRIIERGAGVAHALGTRVGVSWLGGVDGTCRYCEEGRENLCDAPIFTGYDVHGGYATLAIARGDFTYPLDERLSDVEAAPLLCAGIIGFRALRVAGVRPGENVGLFGFGASAHLTLPVLKAWGCRVFVSTRGAKHRAFAESLGADWVSDETTQPPEELDRAVTFAPSGDVVVAALRSLRKGGIVAVNAIHLDRMPQFDYDSLLWGERQIRSVANMTRRDAEDFLALAASLAIRSRVTVFTMDQMVEALRAVKEDRIDGAAVVVMPAIDAF